MEQQRTYSATGVGECEGIPRPCRRCSRCKEWWPLTEDYYGRRSGRGGMAAWQYYCRACQAERAYGKRTASGEGES